MWSAEPSSSNCWPGESLLPGAGDAYGVRPKRRPPRSGVIRRHDGLAAGCRQHRVRGAVVGCQPRRGGAGPLRAAGPAGCKKGGFGVYFDDFDGIPLEMLGAPAERAVRWGRPRTALLVAGAVLCVTTTAIAESSAADEVRGAAAAANRFLETLDPAQARAAVLPPASPLIVNWSNLPAGMVSFERNGVRAGDLRDTQRAALFEFLAAALSSPGAELVQGVIAAEGVLADASRASRLGWSPDNYWLAFFGEPSDGRWLDLAVRRPPPRDQRGGDRRRHEHVTVVHRHRTGGVPAGRIGDRPVAR